MLQVRARQDVGGGAQQLLGAADRPDAFGRAPQEPTVPAERTRGRTRSLTDSSARDHREVLTEALKGIIIHSFTLLGES